MSLIKCPECGHDVSTKAPACPQCGVSIAGNLKRCPVCDTILLKDVEECPQCHTHFVVEQAPEETMTQEEEKVQEVQEVQEPQNTHKSAAAPETPETLPPSRKHRGGWMLTIIIVALVALIGLIVWQMKTGENAAAERAYVLLQSCNDPQNYEDFIMRYPKSPHIADVQARLEELREEETAWKAASITTQADLVKAFIDKYPTSARRAVALHRIDTLEWRQADAAGTSESYTSYINAHEAGDFITEAYTARDEALRRELRARNDSIAAARADSLPLQAPGIDNVFAQ